ncbi:MAG: helix-turn-helix transcriptional regulator [Chitinophagales bacterium]
MKTQFDIQELINKGKIESELELERAYIADRKLKQLSKEDFKYKSIRKKLRDLIETYENKHWSKNASFNAPGIKENDIAESMAEKERLFVEKRKELIRKKLKSLDLNQQQLGIILGHKNKSYISELMNGISPFTLKDLIIIHKLLKIDLGKLIPTTLTYNEQKKIKASLLELKRKNQKFNPENLNLEFA